jgi:[NiFe] hydrogenase large subunit
LVVGGVTCVKDLTPGRIAEFLYVTKETQNFIKNVYIPDLLAVASFYKDWGAIGGTGNFLAWGEFPETDKEPDSLYMPRGVIMKRNLGGVQMAHQARVTEDVTRGWYEDGSAKHPYEGETKPLKENPKYKPGDGKYSWFKAPRYDGEPCEVGPLARVLVAYAKGQKDIKPIVDNVLKTLGVPAAALFSTLGRTAARGIETLAIGEAMQGWVMELVANLKSGDNKTYQPYEMPDSAMGVGLNDVPRGSLGHWVQIEGKKIKNYQYVVPSTWNLGPRDAANKLGPVEESLIGTPVADPKKPLEVLRTVHSFDPCIACGVHVIDPDSNQVYKIKAL